MIIRIARIRTGTNEEGSPMYGPAEIAPGGFISVEITATEYIYVYAPAE